MWAAPVHIVTETSIVVPFGLTFWAMFGEMFGIWWLGVSLGRCLGRCFENVLDKFWGDDLEDVWSRFGAMFGVMCWVMFQDNFLDAFQSCFNLASFGFWSSFALVSSQVKLYHIRFWTNSVYHGPVWICRSRHHDLAKNKYNESCAKTHQKSIYH